MNVLLQGDVGAGKTLVAVHAALVAIQSGHQAAIMAPTEVLAGQHLRSVAALLEGVGAMAFLDLARERGEGRRPGIAPRCRAHLAHRTRRSRTRCSTGAVTGKDRTRIVEGIADGAIDLTIGTHALVQEGVSFHDLSLAVVDEQHRFGLHQRMALKGKGVEPDVLIMTATPIPRTLALTYYGDLDVIVLDEMPKGRQPIDTRAVAPAGRARAGVRTGARRGRGRPAGVRGLRGDRRGQPLAGEGRRGRGGASGHRGLPRSARRSAPRPHAAEGQGGA